MSVVKALKKGAALAAAVRPGKQALRKGDRDRVEESSSVRVVDSLDLDTATKAAHSTAHRWDYLLGTTRADLQLVALEVHPANTGEARVLVAKKRAAQEVLRSSLGQGGQWGDGTGLRVARQSLRAARPRLDYSMLPEFVSSAPG